MFDIVGETQRQQAVVLIFDLEKAYETTWQYGIIRDLHRIGLRGRLPVLCQNISGTVSELGQHSHTNTTQRKVFTLGVSWLPSCTANAIFKALFGDDLAICFRGRSLDTIERHLQQAVNAIQESATRNGFRFAAHKRKVIHFTAPRSRAQRPPLWGSETHFCQWKSPQSSLGCGGTRISHLRSTSVCWRHSARRLSNSSEWSLTWNGEGTETHSWCRTVPLFVL